MRTQRTKGSIRTRSAAIGAAIIAAGLAFGPAYAAEPSTIDEVRAAWEAYEAGERDQMARVGFHRAVANTTIHESVEGWQLVREIIEHPGRVAARDLVSMFLGGHNPYTPHPFEPWQKIEHELLLEAMILELYEEIRGQMEKTELTLQEARAEWETLDAPLPEDHLAANERMMARGRFAVALSRSRIVEEPGGVDFLLMVAQDDPHMEATAMAALAQGEAGSEALLELHERFHERLRDYRERFPGESGRAAAWQDPTGPGMELQMLEMMRLSVATALARGSVHDSSLAGPAWESVRQDLPDEELADLPPEMEWMSAVQLAEVHVPFLAAALLALGPDEFPRRISAEYGDPHPAAIARILAVCGKSVMRDSHGAWIDFDEIHAAHGDAAAEFLRSAAHDWWNHPEADSGLIGYYQGFAMDRDADQGERLAVLREGFAELEASALEANNPAAHAEARARFEVLIRYLEAGEEPVPMRREE